ncbi:MAG TPA: hypothetical protein VEX57_07175 [Microlunatus sp.]|nr:hypothetical protein [Microlunatus sp.]
MPSYQPCRTGDDDQAHLHTAGEPDQALCGRSVSEPTSHPGGRPVCVDCAKELLTKLFRQARRISSIEVVAHD